MCCGALRPAWSTSSVLPSCQAIPSHRSGNSTKFCVYHERMKVSSHYSTKLKVLLLRNILLSKLLPSPITLLFQKIIIYLISYARFQTARKSRIGIISYWRKCIATLCNLIIILKPYFILSWHFQCLHIVFTIRKLEEWQYRLEKEQSFFVTFIY